MSSACPPSTLPHPHGRAATRAHRRPDLASAAGAAALALALGLARPARAEPSPQATSRTAVRLVLGRGAGTDPCPLASALEEGVTARLGYDPFALDAPRVVAVDLALERGIFEARVRSLDASGGVRGTKKLTARAGACGELFDAVALTLAIMIDPLALSGPRPAPDTHPDGASSAPAAPPPSPTASPTQAATATERSESQSPLSSTKATRAHLGAYVYGAVGSGPAPTAGAALAGDWLPSPRIRLGVEARAELPSVGQSSAGGEVVTSLILAVLTGCYGRIVFGCAVASDGLARLSGTNLSDARSYAPFFASAGARLGMDVGVAGPFVLRPFVEAQAILTRHTLRIDEAPRYTFPVATATIGVGGFWSLLR